MPSNSRHTHSSPVKSPRVGAQLRGLTRMHSVAIAALLCLGVAQHPEAQALALGRVVVQSALGEPLRAQIDIPEINAEEEASLRVSLASGEAFSAAGMDFNPALSGLQITLQRRPDGRAYLQISSFRPVTEPFVDLILEANWASGRLVRDYTLLFDPPQLRAAAPVAPAAPLAPGASVAQPAPSAPPAAGAPLPPATPAATAPAQAPATSAAAAPASTPAAPVPAAEEPLGQVTVRAGDTAGEIAQANRPSNISLDQMLVAMLRSNPQAFIGNNVNRLRAGVVLDLPSASEAATVNAGEARQIIAAQSRDFNEFRRRLAGAVPEADVGQPDQQAAGAISTEVQDAGRPATPPDRLTLSKDPATGAGSQEEAIAQQRQAQDTSNRVTELERNIEELAQLQPTTPAAGTTGAAAAPAAEPGLNVPSAPTAADPAAAPAAEAPAATPEPPAAEAPAQAPAVTPAPVLAPAPPPQPLPEEPSIIDQLRDNPLVLPIAGALLALLAGLGLYRLRQRNKSASVDSSFLESRLQPDSFFGSSGGQHIDTAEGSSVSGSSMVYSPSQLDAAGDVDPVAEADVYLAYGRDLQAEEILKEAMRSSPTRVAIHSKLLEIYAKRRDARAFEVVAAEAYNLTQGQGPEWEHACDLGKELDPSNPLYQPGGSPAAKLGAAAGLAGGAVNTRPFEASAIPPDVSASSGALDLDFSFDEPVAASPAAPKDSGISGMDDLNLTDALTDLPDPAPIDNPPSVPMDFDLDFPSEPAPLMAADATPAPADAPATPEASVATFDTDEMLPDFSMEEPQPSEVAASPAPAQPSANDLMSFDLDGLNLDLGGGSEAVLADAEQITEESPLDTKLSLAEEFRAIGDLEGARSLAEEVLAEATGTLKTKARTFLSDLG